MKEIRITRMPIISSNKVSRVSNKKCNGCFDESTLTFLRIEGRSALDGPVASQCNFLIQNFTAAQN